MTNYFIQIQIQQISVQIDGKKKKKEQLVWKINTNTNIKYLIYRTKNG